MSEQEALDDLMGQVPYGSTIIVHRAGQIDKRYVFLGGPPWRLEDERGVASEPSLLEEGFIGLSLVDPNTGHGAGYLALKP